MQCEICGHNMKQIGASLICKNGHTIQNTVETIDDSAGYVTGGRKKHLSVKKKVVKNKANVYDSSVFLFVIFYIIYQQSKEFFGFKNDDMFRYFTGYFSLFKTKPKLLEKVGNDQKERTKKIVEPREEPTPIGLGFNPEIFHRAPLKIKEDEEEKTEKLDPGYIEGDEAMNYVSLLTLIYMSKRAEMEKEGKAYFITDFLKLLHEFNVEQRMKFLIKKYKISDRVFLRVFNFVFKVRIVDIEAKVRSLGSYNSFVDYKVELTEAHQNGVISQRIEQTKKNIRALFSMDIDIYQQYFDHVCKKLNVEQTDDLLLYWRKLVYTYDHDQLFVPESLFTMYIAQYFIDRNNFEDTTLEDSVLVFLNYSRITFCDLMLSFAREKNCYMDPQTLFRSREIKHAERFKNLRRTIWMIKHFKKTYFNKKK